MRFHRLAEPLWYDEAVSVKSASVPLSELTKQLTGGEDSNPPIFSLALKAWMRLAGDSDRAIHALPAVIGAAAVFSALWAGAALGGLSAGLCAAALTAAHPWVLVNSQEARPYALLILLSLWSCFFLLRALESDDHRSWAGFAAATLANLYTHNFAVFLLIGQCAWLWRAGREKWRPFLLAAAAAVALYGPWILFALRQTRALPQLPPVDFHGLIFILFAFGGLWTMAGPAVAHWPAWTLPFFFIAEAAAAVYAVRKLRGKKPALADGLLAAAAVALAVPLLISLGRPIMLAGRHAVVILPITILLASLALSALDNAAARLALLAFFLAACLGTDCAYFSHPKSYDKQIAEFLKEHDAPGMKLLLYPSYRALSIARYFPKAAQSSEGFDVRSEDDLPDRLMLLVEEGRRLKPVQAALLGRYYRVKAERVFGNLAAAALERRGPTAPAPRSGSRARSR